MDLKLDNEGREYRVEVMISGKAHGWQVFMSTKICQSGDNLSK